MKAIYPLAVAAAVVFLSSCFSSMKVRVDALNMPAFKATYLYNVEVLTTRERNIRYLISPAFNQKVLELSAKLSTFIDTSGEVPDNDKTKFQEDIRSRGNDVLKEMEAKGVTALQSASTVKMNATEGSVETYEKDFAAFSVAFNGLMRFNQYAKEIREDFAMSLPDETNALVDDVSATIEAAASAFGESILRDPLASIIAALPEQYWSKYQNEVNLSMNAGGINQKSLGDISKYVKKKPNRYNNTYARTVWGNSDIAIRMAAPGEFIVKGVRVDADEAIRNSFKVVSQGIKYLAYASGIPVVEPGNAPKKSITPLLDSLSKNDAELRFTEEQYAKATDAFLAVLTSAAADLHATAGRGAQTVAQLKDSALARVKTGYAVYKAALANK